VVFPNVMKILDFQDTGGIASVAVRIHYGPKNDSKNGGWDTNAGWTMHEFLNIWSLSPVMKQKMGFNERCYALLRKVPKGKVTTYKALANALGTRAYRAVGQAMKNNPDIPKTPCHRVVASDGSLGGYAHGTETKISILKGEGIRIKDDKIIDFRKRMFEFSF